MKRNLIATMTTLGTMALATLLCPAAQASPLIDENWETGTIDNPPWATANAYVSLSSSQASPFGTGDKSAFFNDTTASSGPALTGNYQATTSRLSVSFDFMIPVAVNNNFTLFIKDAANHSGLFLNLGRGSKIINQLDGAGNGDTIAAIELNTWYHIELTASEAGKGSNTYDISVLKYGDSTPTVVSNLSFRNALDDYSQIGFAANDSGASTGTQVYVDNIVVNAVPEPTAAAFLSLGGLLITVRSFSRFRKKGAFPGSLM